MWWVQRWLSICKKGHLILKSICKKGRIGLMSFSHTQIRLKRESATIQGHSGRNWHRREMKKPPFR
ncbi:hypothetical protein HanRHA438_Chr15g0694881 [Helianthus annuus]|uniref:Uncharacterized protein n=1 Tax=Helianthus annuus TaxID=4232 RepID=A0A251S7L3_HELAN|nr:hypothetical protein HanXRQr2_Chr15g0682831 [Helianthus annuus]KAJ0843757.1 hypothetical protein HanRHA438_Chr15g0694881 [Helianthus annuus]